MTDDTTPDVTTPSIWEVSIEKYAEGKAIGFTALMREGGVPHDAIAEFVHSFTVSDDVSLTPRNPLRG